jgi:Proliferating cell nuclear antigen, C-terminal domain.
MNQHGSLTFLLKRLVNFGKSPSLWETVQWMMSNDVPLSVSLVLDCSSLSSSLFILVSYSLAKFLLEP